MVSKKRLIDIMDTVTKISKKVQPLLRNGCSAQELYDAVLEGIAEAPTVDAVEVVRCKDCKHLMHSAIYKANFCTKIYGLRNICISNNDFCSYGERREGE